MNKRFGLRVVEQARRREPRVVFSTLLHYGCISPREIDSRAFPVAIEREAVMPLRAAIGFLVDELD